MKSVKELLRYKRDGGVWTQDEIRYFIAGAVSETVSAPQVAAFLMAACIHGLRPEEVAALTLSMAESGETIPSGSSRPRIDKHSSGGVGDKVSLLLAPIATCCGIEVPMISGRGLGHTGGTVDKLESVPGLRMVFRMDELLEMLKENHMFMAAQSSTLAPADRILYALRDVTGTVENTGLLTASILSKKLAEQLKGLVMDIKVGSAAFIPTIAQAEEFGTLMKQVATITGLPFQIIFSRMDQPLGRSIGNWVEIAEAEMSLKDPSRCSADLYELTTELTVCMVRLGFPTMSPKAAHDLVGQVWNNGQAHTEFLAMLERQGGDFGAGQDAFAGCSRKDVHASTNGVVQEVKGMPIALGVMNAGGGRKKETDTIDPWVGVELFVKQGSSVNRGDVVATVTASSGQQLDTLHQAVMESVVINKTAPVEPEPSIILQRWIE